MCIAIRMGNWHNDFESREILYLRTMVAPSIKEFAFVKFCSDISQNCSDRSSVLPLELRYTA